MRADVFDAFRLEAGAFTFAELLARPAWQRDAACAEHPMKLFFPERGEPTEPAKAICSRCLVRDECLNYAVDQGAPLWGIWAGTSTRQRLKLRRPAA